jgi:hypothetical protein
VAPLLGLLRFQIWWWDVLMQFCKLASDSAKLQKLAPQLKKRDLQQSAIVGALLFWD